MAIVQISRIQIRSGNLADLPQLAPGELGWADDHRRLFIGNDSTRPDDPAINNTEILTKYSPIEVSGNLVIADVSNLQIGPIDASLNGWFLQSNGNGGVSWVNIQGLVLDPSATVQGSSGQVQFNNGSGLGASPDLSWNDTTSTLSVYNTEIAGNANVDGNLRASTANITIALSASSAVFSNVVEVKMDNPADDAVIITSKLSGNGAAQTDYPTTIYANGTVNANIVLSNTTTSEYIFSNQVAYVTVLEVSANTGSTNIDEREITNDVVFRIGNVTEPTLQATGDSLTFYDTENALSLEISRTGSITGTNTSTVFDYAGNIQANNLSIANAASIGDSITIANSASISNTLTVTNLVTALSNVDIQDSVTIANDAQVGNSLTSKTLVVNQLITTTDLEITGNIDGALLPLQHNAQSIGSATLSWSDLYINNNVYFNEYTFSSDNTNLVITRGVDPANVIIGDLVANTTSLGTTAITDDLTVAKNVTIENNLTVDNTVTVSNNLAVTNDVTAAYFIGDGSNLSMITAANVVGTVDRADLADYAGNITIGAQPNITSVGTLTGLDVAGDMTLSGTLTGVSDIVADQVTIQTDLAVQNSVTVTNDVTAAYFSGDGSNLSSITAANVVGIVTAASVANTVNDSSQPNITSVGRLTSLEIGTTTANLTIDGDGVLIANKITADLITGTLTTNNQPNITQVGQLLDLSVGYTDATTGTIYAVTFDDGGIVTTHDTLIAGNLTVQGLGGIEGQIGINSNSQPNIHEIGRLSTLEVGYTAANGKLYLTAISSGNIDTTDSVTAANVIADSVSADSVTVNTDLTVTANAYVGEQIFADVISANVLWGALAQASQPNITKTGNLVSLNVTGNLLANDIVSNSNVTAQLFTGTLTTASQPNITEIGTLTSLTVATDITAQDITIANTVSASNLVGTLRTSNQSSITRVGNLIGLTLVGTLNLNNNDVTNVDTITAQYFVGDGSNLSNIASANIVGTVARANLADYAGNVIISAQPNITSVGNLTHANVFGNLLIKTSASGTDSVQISNGAISLTNDITGNGANFTEDVRANRFYGNGRTLSSLSAGNIDIGTLDRQRLTGEYDIDISGTSNFARQVTESNQSNITTVGTLTSLTVAGTTNSGLFSGDGGSLSNIRAANIVGIVDHANFADNANLANRVTLSYQPNITRLGTLVELNVLGNTLTDYITVNNDVITNVVAANYVDGLIRTSNQTEITQLGNLVVLDVTGTVTANVVISNLFIGNAEQLYSIPGANITGAVPLSNLAEYVTESNQANIRNLGVLDQVRSNGNITTYNGIYNGDAGGLSNIRAANIVGVMNNASVMNAEQSNRANIALQVAGANVVGTVSEAITSRWVSENAQPNITVLGTLQELDISGSLVGNTANFEHVISNTLYARLTRSDQPEITSVGTLDNLTVSGTVLASTFSGNGSGLTGILGTAVIGTVENATYSEVANIAVEVSNGFQPNITTVGNLYYLHVTGNLEANTLSGNGAGLRNITGANITGIVANANYSAYAGTVFANGVIGNIPLSLSAYTVISSDQPNITSVGNLISLAVDGEITANTINAVITHSIQPNITRLGNLSQLKVIGEANLGDIDNIKISGGNPNNIITTDGFGNLSWTSAGSGTVTRVNLIAGNGISISGSPIVTNGNITVTNSGVTRIEAGSGITINQSTGNVVISADAIYTPPAGSSGAVQYHDVANYEFSGDPLFTYDPSAKMLTVPNISTTGTAYLSSAVIGTGIIASGADTITILDDAPLGLQALDISQTNQWIFLQETTTDFIIKFVNILGVATTGRSVTYTVIVKNNSFNGYICTGIMMDNTSIPTINWLQGTPYPVTNGYDIYTFTVIKTANGYIAFGQRASTQ